MILSGTRGIFDGESDVQADEGVLRMAELVYVTARREAQKLRDVSWDGQFPVDLIPLVHELGAELYSADLGTDLSGVVSKDPNSPARIVVNNRHVERRNRFTIAHELGHVVERKNVAQDDEYSFEEYRGRAYDLHEFFADEFAGELLMPAFAVRDLAATGATPERMAEFFNVSIDAMKKRLERLKKHPA